MFAEQRSCWPALGVGRACRLNCCCTWYPSTWYMATHGRRVHMIRYVHTCSAGREGGRRGSRAVRVCHVFFGPSFTCPSRFMFQSRADNGALLGRTLRARKPRYPGTNVPGTRCTRYVIPTMRVLLVHRHAPYTVPTVYDMHTRPSCPRTRRGLT